MSHHLTDGLLIICITEKEIHSQLNKLIAGFIDIVAIDKPIVKETILNRLFNLFK